LCWTKFPKAKGFARQQYFALEFIWITSLAVQLLKRFYIILFGLLFPLGFDLLNFI